MNILPKKSWHVRTKANIERVRKDEEKAASDEKERQRKIALAEQEARTELLRKKAEKRRAIAGESYASIDTNKDVELSSLDGKCYTSRDTNKDVDLSSLDGKHINFFRGSEEAERLGGNKDYEAEKKAEKEKQEKAIGLLTYLGQSAVEAQTSKPWYFKPPEKKSKPDSSKHHRSISSEEFDLKTKSNLDPMNDMMKYLEKKHKAHGHKDDYVDFGQKRKKHKHKERERSKSCGSSSSGGPKTIEMLRAERLSREKEEKLKQERLLARVRGEKLPEDIPEPVVDDRKRRYNQQYNPELVRRPKKPREYEDYGD